MASNRWEGLERGAERRCLLRTDRRPRALPRARARLAAPAGGSPLVERTHEADLRPLPLFSADQLLRAVQRRLQHAAVRPGAGLAGGGGLPPPLGVSDEQVRGCRPAGQVFLQGAGSQRAASAGGAQAAVERAAPLMLMRRAPTPTPSPLALFVVQAPVGAAQLPLLRPVHHQRPLSPPLVIPAPPPLPRLAAQAALVRLGHLPGHAARLQRHQVGSRGAEGRAQQVLPHPSRAHTPLPVPPPLLTATCLRASPLLQQRARPEA